MGVTIENARFDPPNGASVVKPYVLSHGTLQVYDLAASRPFYEEFLGLEVVRHGPRSMALRCGLKFHIVAVETKDQLTPTSVFSHWGLDVESKAEVDRCHAAARATQAQYGLRQVRDPIEQHGVYSFYMEDRDHNWWEIQYYAGLQHDDFFEFGDMFGEGADKIVK